MTPKAASLSKHLVRAGMVAVFAAGASACSSVPSWVDPTTWIGGGDQASNGDQDAQAADNGQTPDLSTIPDKPQTPSTADEQKDVAQSLGVDRAGAQYSADALKGGTEPAAAPPPTEAPPSTEDLGSDDTAPAPESNPQPAPPPRPAAVMAQTSAPGTLPAVADNTPPPAPAQAMPADAVASTETAPPAVPASSSEAAVPAVPPSSATSASSSEAAVPPPSEAAAPAVPAAGRTQAATTPGDAALGFQPSSAPPLDASVAQFVAPPILARYRQTASIAPSSSVLPGEAPEAIVLFSHDTTVLNSKAREQVRAAAKAFLAQGSEGYICVVGHSSGAGHLVSNFERSQARANAVARALIREGVPAEKVLVQTAGEGQQSEEGGRSAEIFFQS